jgi:hypothetical protein
MVEQVLGRDLLEIERTLHVKAAYVSLATKALGSNAYEDVLDVLRKHWSNGSVAAIEARLAERDVPVETWTHVGD